MKVLTSDVVRRTAWRTRRAIARLTMPLRLREVPVGAIRCQRRHFSEEQGFSGREISAFPPWQFFGRYLVDPEEGRLAFANWYHHWFVEREAWRVAKAEGGMAGGSLYREVARLHSEEEGGSLEDVSDVGSNTVSVAIQNRVDHYFALFESLRHDGFKRSTGDPITALEEDGLFYLQNGHHRAAALSVLGSRVVPLRSRRGKG